MATSPRRSATKQRHLGRLSALPTIDTTALQVTGSSEKFPEKDVFRGFMNSLCKPQSLQAVCTLSALSDGEQHLTWFNLSGQDLIPLIAALAVAVAVITRRFAGRKTGGMRVWRDH